MKVTYICKLFHFTNTLFKFYYAQTGTMHKWIIPHFLFQFPRNALQVILLLPHEKQSICFVLYASLKEAASLQLLFHKRPQNFRLMLTEKMWLIPKQMYFFWKLLFYIRDCLSFPYTHVDFIEMLIRYNGYITFPFINSAV